MKTRIGGSLGSAKQIPADQSEPPSDVRMWVNQSDFILPGPFMAIDLIAVW